MSLLPRPLVQIAKSPCVIMLALLAGLPQHLKAQAADQRTALEHFRDSLASSSDSTSLLLLERSIIDSAKVDRNNTFLHLKLGFVSLRLGELGGHSHYDDAASEFQWAIDL